MTDGAVWWGLGPLASMVGLALWARTRRGSLTRLAQGFQVGSLLALAATAWGLLRGGPDAAGALTAWGLQATPVGLLLALLVQALGAVIAAFSVRYMAGEPGQRRFVGALAAVLAAVHLLLIADHWLWLVAAWAGVGLALQPLLCFYADRPFARLAAHKKRLADRLADAALLLAAGLAWWEVGSGSLSALQAHVAAQGAGPALQGAAIALVLAVAWRTALLPLHGWLIQVMEAPTPVSALLHAGVVNLGGFVLIRLSPLLEQAPAARALLLVLGLGTAVLAGWVMLTRVSVKVRLAWSTTAQMGFMVAECALGLYTLALLHLVGHSLYKAHAFLSASSVVRDQRRRALHAVAQPATASLVLAPLATTATVVTVAAGAAALTGGPSWPVWWSVLLGLAWAPLLWLDARREGLRGTVGQALVGLGFVAALSLAALAGHALPLGVVDAPDALLGPLAALALGALYATQALMQAQPERLSAWRRWSYAGFYLDEAATRLALRLWPTPWVPETSPSLSVPPAPRRWADA